MTSALSDASPSVFHDCVTRVNHNTHKHTHTHTDTHMLVCHTSHLDLCHIRHFTRLEHEGRLVAHGGAALQPLELHVLAVELGVAAAQDGYRNARGLYEV